MATTYPLVNLLHLRSTTQNQVPVNMEAGQIAFNLYNGITPSATGYIVYMFVGTGGDERRDYLGADLTADSMATSLITGEVLQSGKGFTKVFISDEFTPDNPSNLFNISPTVVTKTQAIKELDKLLGLLPNLTTTVKTDLVAAINEVQQSVRDPIVPSATDPTSPTTSWPLWLNTAATDVLGNVGKLNFWNGTTWEEIVSTVTDGGVF